MTTQTRQTRIEYGDFQTPLELAERVCRKLVELGILPEVVIEPTCGVGAFIEAAARAFPVAQKIIGVEVNPSYLATLGKRKELLPGGARIELREGDFFKFNWSTFLREQAGSILVLGNFPWVTNTQQSVIGGANLPVKLNLHGHSGIDAITGQGNFDISEWMLLNVAEWFRQRHGYLAMLCKTAVARKFLKHLYSRQAGLRQAAIYGIDARAHFGVAVEACLLVCEFDPPAHNYDYDIFADLNSASCQRVGHRDGIVVRDLEAFERSGHLFGQSSLKWRSGIKHDCAELMELRQVAGKYINGLGEVADIEPDFVFPLLKGSDVANHRLTASDRYLLVTQRFVGEPTSRLRTTAPKMWAYLEAHADRFEKRKSRIYENNPPFSVFGVGPYTFSPWKIAICSLYKALGFRLVGRIEEKPVVFDDTVYFLSFEREDEARRILDFLTSPAATELLSSMIFWDEKRPIKTSVLNSLRLEPMKQVENLRLF